MTSFYGMQEPENILIAMITTAHYKVWDALLMETMLVGNKFYDFYLYFS